MVSYFERYGFSCPQYTNPADFLFREVLQDGKPSRVVEVLFACGVACGSEPHPITAGKTEAGETYDFIERTAGDAEVTRKDHEAERERINGIIKTWNESPEAQQMQG